MTNDLQNAFDAARTEHAQAGKIGRDPKIDEALKAGKFVVVESYVVHCPTTDATLGEKEGLVETCETRGTAEQAKAEYMEELGGDCGGEIIVTVLPHAPEPEHNPEDDACREADRWDDVPF